MYKDEKFKNIFKLIIIFKKMFENIIIYNKI